MSEAATSSSLAVSRSKTPDLENLLREEEVARDSPGSVRSWPGQHPGPTYIELRRLFRSGPARRQLFESRVSRRALVERDPRRRIVKGIRVAGRARKAFAGTEPVAVESGRVHSLEG